jgi:hypothetical protein
MSKCYIYNGRAYAESFPLSWAMDNKKETGYECCNCIYFCSQYGVLTGYCVNCQKNNYENSRGTTEDTEEHMNESNSKPEYGDKSIFEWFQNLEPDHFEVYRDVRFIFTDTWQEELPSHFLKNIEIVSTIMDWFEIHYEMYPNKKFDNHKRIDSDDSSSPYAVSIVDDYNIPEPFISCPLFGEH